MPLRGVTTGPPYCAHALNPDRAPQLSMGCRGESWPPAWRSGSRSNDGYPAIAELDCRLGPTRGSLACGRAA